MSAAPKYLSLIQNCLLTSGLYIQLQHISTWVTNISNLMCLKRKRCSHPKPLSRISIFQLKALFCLGQKPRDQFFFSSFLYYTSIQENVRALALKYILNLVTSYPLHYHAGPSHHYLFLRLLRSFLCLSLALHNLFLSQGDILKTQVRSRHSSAQNASNVLSSHPE